MALNEIKFACPHCSQHIACDAGYCGYQMECPSCGGRLLVPKLAAFGSVRATALALALPVATPVPRHVPGSLYPRPSGATFWTEAEWDRHVDATEGWGFSGATRGTVMLLLVLAPALLALTVPTSFFAQNNGPGTRQWWWTTWMIFSSICSLLCAAGLAQALSKNLVVRIAITIIVTPVIWGLNASVSFFLGCVTGMMAAQAQSG